MEELERGLAITRSWSRTARRLHDDFEVSVAFVPGKRCLGGMLELLMHCHYLVAVDDARFGWPEVTLPVVPGMEACHWPLRRAAPEDRGRILEMLLTGRPVAAKDARGWLVDFAGPMEEALQAAWSLAGEGMRGVSRRAVEAAPMVSVAAAVPSIPGPDSPLLEQGRDAIMACVRDACGTTLDEALEIQARQAAEFLAGPVCRSGAVGMEYTKTTRI
jgi:enoyl-CoA hydratase/carnithine racemase